MNSKRLDYPFDDVAAQALDVIRRGGTVHQKWTCGHCGVRQTMEEPNRFYKSGRCEECKEVTSIKECNFLAIFTGRNCR